MDEKQKRTTIIPINKRCNKSFQYAVTVTLNHKRKSDGHSEGITKIKSFIDRHNCVGINYSSEKCDWQKSEKSNLTIAFNVLYAKKEKMYPDYVLKHNSKCEKQIILLMIPNREGWRDLTVKILSALLRGITWQYLLNELSSFV